MSLRPVHLSESACSTIRHSYLDPVGPCVFVGRENSSSGKAKVESHLRREDHGSVISPVTPRCAVWAGDVVTPRGAHVNCGINDKRASCRPVVSNASATPSSRVRKRAHGRIAKQAMEESI